MNKSLNAVAELVLNANFDDVCIVCHKNPDGDTIGSAFALHHALKKLEKKCFVFCSDPFPKKFEFITNENDAPFVPKNVITVDVASPSLIGNFEHNDKIKIAIDHHIISTIDAEICYCDPQSASCSEIIFALFPLLNVDYDEYTANALYVGLSTDTGCLRYSNTNKNCYLTAAVLSDYVKDKSFHKLNKLIFETKTKMQLSLEAFATKNVKYEPDEKTAVLVFTLNDKSALGANDDELDCLIIGCISGKRCQKIYSFSQ